MYMKQIYDIRREVLDYETKILSGRSRNIHESEVFDDINAMYEVPVQLSEATYNFFSKIPVIDAFLIQPSNDPIGLSYFVRPRRVFEEKESHIRTDCICRGECQKAPNVYEIQVKEYISRHHKGKKLEDLREQVEKELIVRTYNVARMHSSEQNLSFDDARNSIKETTGYDPNFIIVSPEESGKIPGSFSIYRSKYIDDRGYIMGYKGNNEIEGGIAIHPYKIISPNEYYGSMSEIVGRELKIDLDVFFVRYAIIDMVFGTDLYYRIFR